MNRRVCAHGDHMHLSPNEKRSRAAKFADEWKTAGYERGQSQTFYNEFFEIFGIKRRRVASFEEPVKKLGDKQGFIDLFWKGVLLVEQKSAGRDLTKAKQQAFDYFPGLKDSELPRYILACDFQTFQLHDLEESESHSFGLQELPDKLKLFSFIDGGIQHKFKDEDPVNIKASELMGDLHDALKAAGYEGHDLERFLVRLVFCLFADDTGIFERGILTEYIEKRTSEDGADLGPKLSKLFEVLNASEDKRQKTLDEDLAAFPYVNGELFADRLSLPDFNGAMRSTLLEACHFDWSKVSPAIFGSLFQSVMDKKKRRAIGAHYTNEQNIMKVIGPLFLDDLKAELAKLKVRRDNKRANALKAFQEKLAKIICFDPACGCGNFLVIAYRELRQLETEVILELAKTNRELFAGSFSQVDVDQFYGIEIEEFPARIAETALWMMDHIMNMRLSEALGEYQPRIPLKAKPTIRNADALETDWATVLPPEQCSYVFGNPPFVGAKMQSEAQRKQVHAIANLGKKKGTLDFVCSWFLKAGAYINAQPSPLAGEGARRAGEGLAAIGLADRNPSSVSRQESGRDPPSPARGEGRNIAIGFVATNSITQGEQVAELWPLLFDRYHLEIAFAHRTFAWGSEARGKANVHVVIIGMTRAEAQPAEKRLFDYEDIKKDPTEAKVKVISPYLFDAGLLGDPHTVVLEASKPLSFFPSMVIGSKPIDGGYLIVDEGEDIEFLMNEPEAAPFLRPYIGSVDFIQGGGRHILALQNAKPEQLRKLPLCLKRVEQVRNFRLGKIPARLKQGQDIKEPGISSSALAATPTAFHVTVIPLSSFLVVPEVSSENRNYVPIGYLQPPTIPSNLVRIIPNATTSHFSLITSRMHMSWLRFIGGRLKSDYRYSIGLVYNPFPWPELDEAKKAKLNKMGQAILDARLNHPQSTLADLYDPLTMPADLRKAHEANDKAVDQLYRKETFASDRARVEFLLARYEQITAPALALAAQKPKRAKKK
jgi:N-6 DNA Methylase